MQGRGGGGNPEDIDSPPPDQHALPAHGVQAREGVGAPDQDAEGEYPPNQRALPVHGMQERGGGAPGKGGGAPPEQERMPFVRGLIQEMGGSPQDLRSPPPTAILSKGGEGAGGE